MLNSRTCMRIRLILASIVLCFLAIVAYLDLAGMPQWLKNNMLRRFSKGDLSFDVDTLHCHVLRALDVKGLRVFTYGQIGQPVVEAERVFFKIDPLAKIRDESIVPSIYLENVVVRPTLIGGGSHAKEGAYTELDINIHLQKAEIGSLNVRELRARYQHNADGVSLTELTATLHNDDGALLHLDGDIWYSRADNVYSGEITIEGNPHLLVGPFRDWGMLFTPELISRFGFKASEPRCTVKFYRGGEDKKTWMANGRFWMEEGTYNGVDVLRADCTYDFQIGPTVRIFEVNPLLVVREEGLAFGGLTFDGSDGKRALEFDLSSGLDPHALVGIVGVMTNLVSTNVLFEVPYRVNVKGLHDINTPALSRISAEVDLGSIDTGKIQLSNVSFAWSRHGFVDSFDDMRALFCGGVLEGDGYLAKPADSDVTSAFFSGDWRGVDLKTFADRLIGEDAHAFSGDMKGHLHLVGVTGAANRHSWAGNGDLRISGGQLLRLPVFGGLTKYMGKALPGVDLLLSQTDASASYRVSNERIQFDEVRVEGDVLSLLGKGQCDFDRELDFAVELTFFRAHTLVAKIVRLPTFILSKLLEFRVVGPTTSPHWYPVNFSKDLWERLGLKSSDRDRPPKHAPPEKEQD
ncbi:MAG: hypothetical protein OSB41_06275 [Kiritimatiellae bacterium]|nr:hypothetical protein [Kiritimatiellia bacterium]